MVEHLVGASKLLWLKRKFGEQKGRKQQIELYFDVCVGKSPFNIKFAFECAAKTWTSVNRVELHKSLWKSWKLYNIWRADQMHLGREQLRPFFVESGFNFIYSKFFKVNSISFIQQNEEKTHVLLLKFERNLFIMYGFNISFFYRSFRGFIEQFYQCFFFVCSIVSSS